MNEIFEDLRHGRMIVLVDDEHRENEGDLVCAAQHITPDTVNFMLRQARGMLCVALSHQLCEKLQLEPQSRINTTQRGTGYTVTVDAHQRFSITTGVSASDRATTIRLLADPQATPVDFARPGHVQPLCARPGGSLVRAGQTEGSIDLCRLAGLTPAAAIIEVMNDDGTMSRRPDLEKFCHQHQLKMCTVADVIHYRLQLEMLVERLGEYAIQTPHGSWQLIAYRSLVDPLPHVALVYGQPASAQHFFREDESVLVRMHSQNLLGDVFGDHSQPSGQTLHASMKMIQQHGRGAVVYLRHEGMGQGLLRTLQTFHLATAPDESERLRLGTSHTTPGTAPPTDKRDYGIGSQILRDLGIRKLSLLTNHPFTPTALSGFGLEIVRFLPVVS